MRSIKKSLLKLAVLLCLASTTYVYAGAYVMPVDTVPSGNQAVTTMEIIAWTEEEGIPNPCYRNKPCYVGPDVLYKNNNRPGMQGSCEEARVCLNDAENYRTTADVMRAYKRKFGIPKQVTFTIMTKDADCIGLFYTNHISSGYGYAQQFPNSTCNKMPPPNQTCKLDLPSEIAYGELTAKEVNNATRTIIGSVSCALSSSSITLRTTVTNERERIYLDPDKQIYATLLINGKNTENGVRIEVKEKYEEKKFELTSILHTPILPKAGKYEGVAVVHLTYL
ncbi:MrpH family fimbial adhesin [Xenorhabdus sp. IM139775]|uniref:MrpH family fimbial adhesin n=1 Tax=Xenorhabdus sp. IM139775 TaxID=3025876 RepID=UPI002359A695|nr:pilus assembly protein [Xenorhabdus sp. IM139775]MDC9593045.1 pilus assembly protein [Xenorhabdus sp. IM139775]